MRAPAPVPQPKSMLPFFLTSEDLVGFCWLLSISRSSMSVVSYAPTKSPSLSVSIGLKVGGEPPAKGSPFSEAITTVVYMFTDRIGKLSQ